MRRVIVVGASAGGVEALTAMARGLPADLPAAVVIVVHLPPDAESHLPQILGRAGPLPCHSVVDGAELAAGVLYAAPPDRHTVLAGGRMWLVDGPRENRVRPAIDPLFRSAAKEYDRRAVGVILSGTLDDGSAGLAAISAAHGVTIVQDPEDAYATGMPRSALAQVHVDHVVRAAETGPLLGRVVAQTQPAQALVTVEPDDARRALQLDLAATERELVQAPPTDLSCPACGGVLRDVSGAGVPRYRCRVGHTYVSEALLDAQHERTEEALWSALRALEEEAVLAGRLAARARALGAPAAERRFDNRRREAAQQADVVRSTIPSMMPLLRRGTEASERQASPTSADRRHVSPIERVEASEVD